MHFMDCFNIILLYTFSTIMQMRKYSRPQEQTLRRRGTKQAETEGKNELKNEENIKKFKEDTHTDRI